MKIVKSNDTLAPNASINITIEGALEQRVCINIADESVELNQQSKMTNDKIFKMLGPISKLF